MSDSAETHESTPELPAPGDNPIAESGHEHIATASGVIQQCPALLPPGIPRAAPTSLSCAASGCARSDSPRQVDQRAHPRPHQGPSVSRLPFPGSAGLNSARRPPPPLRTRLVWYCRCRCLGLWTLALQSGLASALSLVPSFVDRSPPAPAASQDTNAPRPTTRTKQRGGRVVGLGDSPKTLMWRGREGV